MTNALEGTEPAKPTLREQANAPRIGRARFIGHVVGYVLIIALIGTPLVGLYTGFLFWTFKGKVKLDEMSY